MTAHPSTRLRCTVFPRAERSIRDRHPWIFADSIKSQNRDGESGEFAVIYDAKNRFLAVGLYDPDSTIRIRVLQALQPAPLGEDWFRQKLQQAQAARATIDSPQTNGLRLIQGESEGFPGIVADRYANTLVVKIYCASWFPHWPMLEKLFREQIQPDFVVLRLSRNVEKTAARAGIHPGFQGTPGPEVVHFTENGLHFESAVLHGQKTGFFLDQRDNRQRVEALAKGRVVLNVFSFSGAFSLYAARGGAKSVSDLDISAHALDSSERNFALNANISNISRCKKHRIQADAFAWMEDAPQNLSYDLIIVDPPSLAKKESERQGAQRAYARLNALAIQRLKRSGILVAASCSAHVSADAFFRIILENARQSNRTYRVLWQSEHAADHPANFPEAKYLKAIAIEFDV